MIKTIEELTQDAEYAGLMLAHYTADEDAHRLEALRSGAEKLKWRRELDDIERQLIAASGEAS